jgi:hypothetical protein
MNKYLDALWELKLRVDAYNEYDEKANKAFELLQEAITKIQEQPEQSKTVDSSDNILDFIKEHTEVQEHPDMFFYREYPERVLIDLRYKVQTNGFVSGDDTSENNMMYNKVKKWLGLPEYKEK